MMQARGLCYSMQGCSLSSSDRGWKKNHVDLNPRRRRQNALTLILKNSEIQRTFIQIQDMYYMSLLNMDFGRVHLGAIESLSEISVHSKATEAIPVQD